MKTIFTFACLLLSTLLSVNICAAASDPSVVQTVDLQRYAGLWYQVAHYPSFFLNSCESSTAEYSLNKDGSIGVLNTCYKKNNGQSSIQGTARAENPAEPTKLKVDFGFFAKGNYWIIDLDPSYQWAVVSGPGRSSLFVLSRQAPMDPYVLASIIEKLKADGFDGSKIIFDKY